MSTTLSSILLTLAAATSVSAPALFAQAPAAPATQTLPSAREVLDRHVEASKAKTVIEKTRSMRMTGTVELPGGMTGKTDVWAGKPDLRFSTLDLGSSIGKIVNGYDGKNAWMIHPMMGARILTGTEALQATIEADYNSSLKTEEHYETIRTLSRETFEGKDCYKVELVAKPLPGMDPASTLRARTSTEYYDVATGLLHASSGVQEGEMGKQPYTTVLSDYKDYGGALHPTKTVFRVAEQEIVMTISAIEYDTATPETFQPPLEIRKLIEAQATPATAPKPQ